MRGGSLLLIALLLACSFESITEGEPAGTTAPPATTTTSSVGTTGKPSTGAGDDAASTGDATSNQSTGDATTTSDPQSTGGASSSGGSTSGSTSTGHDEAPIYSVHCLKAETCSLFGVRKQDFGSDRCAYVVVGAGKGQVFATTPNGWGAEQAGAVSTTQCWPEADGEEPDGVMDEQVVAVSGEGSIEFTFDGMCPVEVAVDLVLTFEQPPPWLPVEETLKSATIPVLDCG
jgi:hypothetical protein